MQEHLDIINGAEKDPGKVRGAAVEINKGFNALKQTKHRDDLRNLRSSVERRLQEKGLAQGTRDALADLSKTLEEHAIEEPLMPTDLGKKTGDKMPVDAVKMPTEKAVDGFNETVQRTYEEGKRMWNNKEHPVLGKAAVIVAAAGAAYVVYHGIKWIFEKAADAVEWAWDNKWTVLTLGAVGYGAYKLGENSANAKNMEAEQKKAAAKGKETFKGKQKLTMKDIEESKEPLDLTALDQPLVVERGTRKAEVQLVKKGNETLLKVNGKAYRAETEVPILGKQNLSEKLKFALKYPGNSKLHAATVRMIGDVYVDMDALTTTVLTLADATGKKTEQEVEYWTEDKNSKENVVSHKNQKLGKKTLKVTFTEA